MFIGDLILSFKLLIYVICMIEIFKIIFTETKEHKCTKITHDECAV